MPRASITSSEPDAAAVAAESTLELDDLTGVQPESITKAAPGSPLFNLRATREAGRAKLFTDLPVPRWAENGTRLCVRYGPLSQGRMEALAKGAERSKDPEKAVRLNARVLAEAAQGVFVIVGEDPENPGELIRVGADQSSPDATDPVNWPRFDDHLAASLGLQAGLPAADLVRELFFTDGDLVSTANRLVAWSGYVTNNDDLSDELGN